MALQRRHLETVTVTTSTDGLSGIGALGDMLLVGLEMPSTWTAAALTFQGSVPDTTTFGDIFDGGVELNETVAAAQYIVLDPAQFAGVDRIKVRSGTTITSVAQAAERTFNLSLLAATQVRR